MSGGSIAYEEMTYYAVTRERDWLKRPTKRLVKLLVCHSWGCYFDSLFCIDLSVVQLEAPRLHGVNDFYNF